VVIKNNDGKSKAYVVGTDILFEDNVVHLVSGLVIPGEWKEGYEDDGDD